MKHSLLIISLLLLSGNNLMAQTQQECCARLLNGVFIPLNCMQALGGTVLTLPERMILGIPPIQCRQTMTPNQSQMPMMMGPVMMPPMMPLFFRPIMY